MFGKRRYQRALDELGKENQRLREALAFAQSRFMYLGRSSVDNSWVTSYAKEAEARLSEYQTKGK